MYEDLDTEILNAKTLAFKQLQTFDRRKQVHRVAWILEKQDSDSIRKDIMILCDTTARTPGKKARKEQHAEQGGNGRKIPQEDGEEYCGHDGAPGPPDETDLNTRSSKRNRKQPQDFNPEQDGANDGARRLAGNKCRCYDWLNAITTCHA